MYRVAVMYPKQADAKFDYDYYKNTHLKLVEEHLKPFGLIKTEADRGVSGGGDAEAPYIAVGYLYFENLDGYDKGTAEKGTILRGDIDNFTNVMPVRLVSEIL